MTDRENPSMSIVTARQNIQSAPCDPREEVSLTSSSLRMSRGWEVQRQGRSGYCLRLLRLLPRRLHPLRGLEGPCQCSCRRSNGWGPRTSGWCPRCRACCSLPEGLERHHGELLGHRLRVRGRGGIGAFSKRFPGISKGGGNILTALAVVRDADRNLPQSRISYIGRRRRYYVIADRNHRRSTRTRSRSESNGKGNCQYPFKQAARAEVATRVEGIEAPEGDPKWKKREDRGSDGRADE